MELRQSSYKVEVAVGALLLLSDQFPFACGTVIVRLPLRITFACAGQHHGGEQHAAEEQGASEHQQDAAPATAATFVLHRSALRGHRPMRCPGSYGVTLSKHVEFERAEALGGEFAQHGGGVTGFGERERAGAQLLAMGVVEAGERLCAGAVISDDVDRVGIGVTQPQRWVRVPRFGVLQEAQAQVGAQRHAAGGCVVIAGRVIGALRCLPGGAEMQHLVAVA